MHYNINPILPHVFILQQSFSYVSQLFCVHRSGIHRDITFNLLYKVYEVKVEKR